MPTDPRVAHVREARDLLRMVLDDLPIGDVVEAAVLCIESVREGGKILICGNGGSAADAQHFAAELMVRFAADGKPIPAIALTTDTSLLTACTNDLGFHHVFARQVEALGVAGDVLIAITTSGRSPNVAEALAAASARNMDTLALTGRAGLATGVEADLLVRIQSDETARIQEAHIFVLHMIAELVEGACRQPI